MNSMGMTALERQLLSPIEEMVESIERRLEHQYGQCRPDCVTCARTNCNDCEKERIVNGWGELATVVVTQPCETHA
jgi:hypothetical protein